MAASFELMLKSRISGDCKNNQGVSVFDLVRHPGSKALLEHVAASAPESSG